MTEQIATLSVKGLGLRYDTFVDHERAIVVQDTLAEFYDGAVQKIATRVMETRDAHIRTALIQLGWTPPPDGRDGWPSRPSNSEESA